jgi:subtilisin family serine protease
MQSAKSCAIRAAFVAAVGLLVPSSALAEGRYIVKYRDGAKARAALVGVGARVIKELAPQNAAAARIPDQALAALRSNPHIEFIEEDPIRAPLAQSTPYGITLIQAKDAQQVYGVSGGNRTVCVVDSGLYVGHEDHLGNSASGFPTGWNSDGCGHGTHVAGTIAAINNTVGVEGVLPNGANLYIVKVFGDDCGWAYASDLVDAANRCAAAGANVINMSLGGGRPSLLEESAFNSLWSQGLLSIAAAGNDGSSAYNYPASYGSVVSVAAVDSSKNIASFSQFNSAVDLAAPGVAVESTVGWTETNTLSDGSNTWSGNHVEYSARKTASGTIVDGGLCTSPGAWGGAVVLCQRGTNSFHDKVANVQQGGGVAAVLYNNVAGNVFATLGTGNTSAIPAITLTDADGAAALGSLGLTGTVTSTLVSPDSGYRLMDGTSMAAPHVAGVAALVWSYRTSWSNGQIRDALEKTAEDLGTPGRDDRYGHGLVRARAALDYLTIDSGSATDSIALATSGRKVKGTAYVDLRWSGASSAVVDIYRNGSFVTSTANDGAHTDGPLGKGGGSFRYKVCAHASSVCSNEPTVSF